MADADQTVNRREHVLRLCGALPGSTLSYPFGEHTAVYKAGGKMFALVDLRGEHGRATLKAEPARVAALVFRHPQIVPGHYMNKRHWITADLGGAVHLPAPLLEDLVEDSYDLIVARLPVRLRPPVGSPPDGEAAR